MDPQQFRAPYLAKDRIWQAADSLLDQPEFPCFHIETDTTFTSGLFTKAFCGRVCFHS